MKILHVIASLAPEHGGPTQACLGMARAVARRGHDVAIHTTDIDVPVVGDGHVSGPDGLAIHYHQADWPRRWARSPGLGRALARAVPGVDVVHLHSLYLYHDWAVHRLCARHRVPYLLRPHGTLDPYIRRRHRLRKRAVSLWYQDRVTRDAAALHFTTAGEQQLAQPASHGRPGVVVPVGIAPADYAPLPHGRFRAAHPEIGARQIVLFFGRLNFKKGLEIVVGAFAAAAARRDDVWLVLAGPDDGMRGQIEAWLHDYGVADRASFAGMLTGDEKLAALADVALFVLPSFSENFGIAVVEAMVCGLPVVISDRVNIWPEVAAAGAGAVARPAVEPFAEAIERLLAEPALGKAMGAAGQQLVRARYDWAGVAEQLEGVYAAIAAGEALAEAA